MAEHDDEDENGFEWSKFLLIKHDNNLLKIWLVLDTSCCLISSYAYAFLAHFGNTTPASGPTKFPECFEIIFTISIILRFITSYVPEGNIIPVTSHYLIFQNYKNTDLMRDLITWFPIVFLLDTTKGKFFRLFFLVKVLRITKALAKFDVMYIMN